jgi:hypothetical protein
MGADEARDCRFHQRLRFLEGHPILLLEKLANQRRQIHSRLRQRDLDVAGRAARLRPGRLADSQPDVSASNTSQGVQRLNRPNDEIGRGMICNACFVRRRSRDSAGPALACPVDGLRWDDVRRPPTALQISLSRAAVRISGLQPLAALHLPRSCDRIPRLETDWSLDDGSGSPR